MPKVSIVIPVYNTEKYIRQCLDSVVNQILKDIEIICVIDGSQDGSSDICRAYAANDSRIRVIDHVKNRGGLAARKTGVDAAKGEYIMFLDSDDWLEVDACSRLYDYIKSYGVDILHFGSFIDAEPSVPIERIAGVEKFIAPYLDKLTGKNILKERFWRKNFALLSGTKYTMQLFAKKHIRLSILLTIYLRLTICVFSFG